MSASVRLVAFALALAALFAAAFLIGGAVDPDVDVKANEHEGSSGMTTTSTRGDDGEHAAGHSSGPTGRLPGHATGGSPPADAIAFDVSYPSAGSYALFLQFRHAGSIRTARFTVDVEASGG